MTSSSVRDERERHRFVLRRDGSIASLQYRSEPGRLTLVHTEVPDQLGGQGIGGELVRAAIARARAEDLTVGPACPFARRWLRQHPEVAETVSIDWSVPERG
jgi:uncharacterized protein